MAGLLVSIRGEPRHSQERQRVEGQSHTFTYFEEWQ